MKIKANGHEQEISPGTTIAGLIAQHKLTPDKVAIELNKRLVRAVKYDMVLNDGDEVEIVTFVGGG